MTADDWPMICVPKCPITDDDIEFLSDLMYLKDLKQSIHNIDRSAELPEEFNVGLVWAIKHQLSEIDAAFAPKSLLSQMLTDWKEQNRVR